MCCKSRDQKLTILERIRLSFHHFLCFTCRRFSRQISMLDIACQKLYSKEELAGMKEGKNLSDSAKRKISNALKEEKSKSSS